MVHHEKQAHVVNLHKTQVRQDCCVTPLHLAQAHVLVSKAAGFSRTDHSEADASALTAITIGLPCFVTPAQTPVHDCTLARQAAVHALEDRPGSDFRQGRANASNMQAAAQRLLVMMRLPWCGRYLQDLCSPLLQGCRCTGMMFHCL